MMKKVIALVLALVCMTSMLTVVGAEETTAPKYVFMFIGDGMGSPQITATEYFLGAVENPDAELPVASPLTFSGFESLGLMTTYDATSFCPDSASTASAMASGEKIFSGVINYAVDMETPLTTISEYAKEAGYKVGVVSSVSIDHATPAAYYAQQQSRNDYYDISVQAMTNGIVDFIGGGAFQKPDGSDGEQTNIYDMGVENGFTIANDIPSIQALSASDAPVLAYVPDLIGSAAMQYEVDRLAIVEEGGESLSLADMTQAAIDVCDNGEDGFFIMVEGGKVDWAGHANDALTNIYETIALSDAVQTALDFASEHPDETLIIVTGDHETGGLTIGFATTAYDTHLEYLANQTMSYDQFDAVVDGLAKDNADFDTAMAAVTAAFGLTAEEGQDLTLTADELATLQGAYEMSMTPSADREYSANDSLIYGGYEPLTVTACHILNNKAGLAFTSYSHTGIQIPVYATGACASVFTGIYDNTDIFAKTMEVMGLAK